MKKRILLLLSLSCLSFSSYYKKLEQNMEKIKETVEMEELSRVDMSEKRMVSVRMWDLELQNLVLMIYERLPVEEKEYLERGWEKNTKKRIAEEFERDRRVAGYPSLFEDDTYIVEAIEKRIKFLEKKYRKYFGEEDFMDSFIQD